MGNESDPHRWGTEPLLSGFVVKNNIIMTTKVNILIDGGFFTQKFREANNRVPKAQDVQNEVDCIMQKLRAKTNNETNDILFRVYYYDCKPFDGVVKDHTGKEDVDFSTSKLCKASTLYLYDICKLEKFAVRLGELSFDGWKQDLHNKEKWRPDFKQKGVDMKVGLDMALMGLKHTCDKIVLVAGDSDFIAPIKFVRKEGLQVYLYAMGHKVKGHLIEHCDFKLS